MSKKRGNGVSLVKCSCGARILAGKKICSVCGAVLEKDKPKTVRRPLNNNRGNGHHQGYSGAR